MSKSLKAQLQQKAEENTQRHREANYRDDFDVGRQHSKIHLEKIDPNPYQPRINFPEEEIRELALSISTVGLLQPISVRIAGDRFQLIAGERRLRAHRLLGKPTIEALVISVDEAESATLALAENIERQDLTDFEIGESIRRLEEHFPKRTKLAESLGIQRSDLYRYLSFADLPEMIRASLTVNPKLLSRSAASDIVKVLKDVGINALIDARMTDALSLLEQGRLDQTKFADYLAQKPPKPPTVRNRPTHLMRHGARVGSFLKGPDEIVMKVSSSALDDEQVEKLQRFVLDLLQ
jgi:ParB family transcriptional regulator, chromosome partitioning protein